MSGRTSGKFSRLHSQQKYEVYVIKTFDYTVSLSVVCCGVGFAGSLEIAALI